MGCILVRKKTAERGGMAGLCNLYGCIANTIPTSRKRALLSDVQPEFCNLLKDLISAHYKSRRAFVLAAHPESAVRSVTAYLSQVIAGKKPPPLDHLPAWADALKLTGEQRQRFEDFAAIAHLPEVVQPRFIALLRQFDAAKAKLKRFEVRIELVEGNSE